jgi:hypothetical protein
LITAYAFGSINILTSLCDDDSDEEDDDGDDDETVDCEEQSTKVCS